MKPSHEVAIAAPTDVPLKLTNDVTRSRNGLGDHLSPYLELEEVLNPPRAFPNVDKVRHLLHFKDPGVVGTDVPIGCLFVRMPCCVKTSKPRGLVQ